ncbi:NAD(P)-dependent dehydrogenase, short-chain alcohol dehydrogenase family [Gracilibacillus orientalis]|uniref:NAD(P)-dependent dehydrogenase, short-chain alcohol dehydrogenase family n=1 Tax=Gracilibacillus orientalis TaxID=334253 RepID=A0A1I4GXG1_9BACI|nr:short chain dehydrogenase [Gracilibacillus orientalis]SFL33826.1 NAD(P)-dependent dehydrogenase, short-chain alcohol dehydrogenase family [Gracilibacillus orientalis]
MKILLIGASGTIGSVVLEEMKKDAEIITAGIENSDITVDTTSPESIKQMYEQVGTVDAIVNTAGIEHYGFLKEMTPEQNQIAVQSKLSGQVNLVLLGMDALSDNGSFTLTTGILMDDPIVKGASAAMANGGVRAFVKSAAIEMPRGLRINHVSPTILEVSVEKNGHLFEGFEPVSSRRIGLAYRKSILGAQTGEGIYVY